MTNSDAISGRVKEAAGDLTDNDKLKKKGKVEQAEGTAKDKIDEAADAIKKKV